MKTEDNNVRYTTQFTLDPRPNQPIEYYGFNSSF